MNQAKIRDALDNVLKEQGYEPEENRREIAFHLTDWLKELEEWNRFCQAPESFDSTAAEAMVTSFLLHAPNHLAAASKLMLDVPVTDIFDVGATTEDDAANAV